jgi:hypothetical protein
MAMPPISNNGINFINIFIGGVCLSGLSLIIGNLKPLAGLNIHASGHVYRGVQIRLLTGDFKPVKKTTRRSFL